MVNLFSCFLFFNRHIILVGKYKCWGPYEQIWALHVDDLMAVPTIQKEKLVFSVRQVRNSLFLRNIFYR